VSSASRVIKHDSIRTKINTLRKNRIRFPIDLMIAYSPEVLKSENCTCPMQWKVVGL